MLIYKRNKVKVIKVINYLITYIFLLYFIDMHYIKLYFQVVKVDYITIFKTRFKINYL